MNYRTPIFILALIFTGTISAQTETYTVRKAPFSSHHYDEFCPVYYRNGLVFTSNRKTSQFLEYSSSQGNTPFKINYVDTTLKGIRQSPVLFSKYLKTNYNDGPASFSSRFDTIYFSRNLKVDGKLKELSSFRNKLGIFYAVYEDKKWDKIRELRFNNEWYNITTPWLSPDGKRLYFASDKPEGYGGSDIYFCQWKGYYWDEPVNLGPVINTSGNEAYPFVNPAGELLFASDGHPGLGGRDIFFSRFQSNKWLPPVRLDPPVNSEYDDFSIITDSLMSEGFFASNRDGSIDIFNFKTRLPQIFYANIQKENQYCFSFSDSGAISVDTLNLRYVWDFGDGKKAYGAVVQHCFPGPGTYKVKLDIIDRTSGSLFFNKLRYTIDLLDFQQPYITSPEVVVAGEEISFDGSDSYLPGYTVLDHTWVFGEGTRMQGESVKHTFSKPGEYTVNMGLTLKSESNGIIHKTGVSKKITVLKNDQERISLTAKKASEKAVVPDIRKFENAFIRTEYSAETDFRQDAIFSVQFLTSKTRLEMSNVIFKTIASKYNLREIAGADGYSYHADDCISLMEAYPPFREISGLGFKTAEVKLNIIKDPVEKELFDIRKNYGVQADTYFDTYGRFKAAAYLLLDQIVILMNRNPGIRLEVAYHTDNTGTAAANLKISQTRAQQMVNYLVNRGVNVKRLVARGYGSTRPVTINILEADRKLNRRIDFRIIN